MSKLTKRFLAIFGVIATFWLGYKIGSSNLNKENIRQGFKKELQQELARSMKDITGRVDMVYVPSFIKGEMARFKIEPKKLDFEVWKRFVSDIKAEAITDLEKSAEGFSLLHYLTSKGLISSVKMIVKNGVSIEKLDKHNRNALSFAFEFSNPDIVYDIIELGGNLYHEANYGGKKLDMLHFALRNENPKNKFANVKFLLGNGFSLSDRKKYFEVANTRDNRHYLVSMIDGFDINNRLRIGKQDRTYFEWLLSSDHTDALLMRAMEAHKINYKKTKALHIAAQNEFSTQEVLKALLKHKMNINARDEKKRTPLMLSCASKNAQKVEFLLKNGARTDLKDISGKTFFDYLKNTKEFLDIEKKEIMNLAKKKKK